MVNRRRSRSKTASSEAIRSESAELATERDAINVARKLADEMGVSVTVRDVNYAVIATIPAPPVH